MLDAAQRTGFESAVELGCAEGIFTERLAPLCRSLEGLDFSEIALERARHRLAGYPNVMFRRWDMRNEPLRGKHDLIVAMGVITSLYRPGDVRRMCEKIVDAIQMNGFLLFSDVRQSRVFEDAWWGRFVLRGGEQIRRLLSRDPRLDLVASADTASHVFALYQRKA
jgi:predicted TPR repeat methyltransferase